MNKLEKTLDKVLDYSIMIAGTLSLWAGCIVLLALAKHILFG